jgi:hypothetical protein
MIILARRPARRHSSPMRPSEYTARCTTPPARHFAASLYSGLAFGNSVKRAFHQACAVIGDEPHSVMPQLFVRHGIDPHMVVLVRPEEEEGGTP